MDRQKDPLNHEDRYFIEKERDAIEKLRAKREAKLAQEAGGLEASRIEEIRAAHWMKCPKCGHDMEEVDTEGVLLDRCTRCEGIYLDRGELEDMFLRKLEDRRNIFRKILGI